MTDTLPRVIAHWTVHRGHRRRQEGRLLVREATDRADAQAAEVVLQSRHVPPRVESDDWTTVAALGVVDWQGVRFHG